VREDYYRGIPSRASGYNYIFMHLAKIEYFQVMGNCSREKQGENIIIRGGKEKCKELIDRPHLS